MKALITGFDPFDGASINPAYELIRQLPDKILGYEIVKEEIPTIFDKSLAVLESAIEREQPDFVICLGQAGGRYKISTECIGINLNEARIKDNAGNKPSGTPVKADGQTAYFATLPNKAIVNTLIENNIPAEISYTAGTFVCNHLLYGLMYIIERSYPNMRGGFIHVPFLPEQVIDQKDKPSMSFDMMAKAIELAIQATIKNKLDIKFEGGIIS